MSDPTSERQRLLSLVADHILASGVSGLTLRGVSRAVGSNNRMLLYYFESKEQLIAAGLAEVHVRFPRLRHALDGLHGTAPLPDRLHEAWRDIAAPENVPFLRLFFEVFGLAAHDPDRYRAFLDTVGTDAVTRVAAAFEADGAAPDVAQRLGTEVVALWRGLQFALLSGAAPEALDAVHRAAVARLR
ncbi:TetR/AcrR family transcriptional regulator [Cryptosporangium aurantiacum]|uniref:Transcriptional regulator, TetR family n=1 Tax=Cryptosporangium aurantiacum TaxID=134849 RepID=A0A1M7QYC0_9ACTN|nr:TetR/AcrR family transcriptional regulator [Cryptosporangium aurantiacum]SHN36994.1 transcriptional regulator, TetR family [Cryptosporangium aurantiacum]